MPILTVYPDPDVETTSVDGYADRTGVDETWAVIIAGAGNGSNDTSASGPIIQISASDTADQWATVRRGIFLFDTSALGASATISDAVMSLYGGIKLDLLDITPDIDIYTSTPASNTAVANGDYAQLGSVSQTGSPITYANWTDAVYNDFTFNATGRGNVSKTGVSKFGTRNANYDVAAVAPTHTASSQTRMLCSFADQAGTSEDPKLVITYTSTRIRDVIMGGVVVRAR